MQLIGLRVSSFPEGLRVLEHLLDGVLHRPEVLFNLFSSGLGFGRMHAALHPPDFALDMALDVVQAAFGLFHISV